MFSTVSTLNCSGLSKLSTSVSPANLVKIDGAWPVRCLQQIKDKLVQFVKAASSDSNRAQVEAA